MSQILLFILFNVIFGIAIAFYGKKIYNAILAIIVILISSGLVFSKYGFSNKGIIMAIVLAILIIFLFSFFIKLGLFLLGMIFGGILGYFLLRFMPEAILSHQNTFVLIISVLMGLITALGQDFIIILVTSFSGASIVAKSILFLVFNFQSILNTKINLTSISDLNKYINQNFVNKNSNTVLIATLILATFGFLYQRKHMRKK